MQGAFRALRRRPFGVVLGHPGPVESARTAGYQAVANAFWDDHYRTLDADGQPVCDPIDYTRHPFLYAHAVCVPLTGAPTTFWLDDVAQKHLVPPAQRVLSLGCGTAEVEEHLVSRGYAHHIVAYDPSRKAIEAARRRLATTAWAHRIDLRSGDPSVDAMEAASFDLVFVEAAIHHFLDIEAMYALMYKVLKKEGLLIFDEYVGPDRHQYPDDLVELLNRVNECLADGYRRDCDSGAVRERVEPAPLEWMLTNDPTEGAHASRILPLTYQYFDVLERRNYGGAIVRPLFSKILPNWDFDDPKDQTVARLIILLERELGRRGILPHHNTVIVARPRPAPRRPLTEQETARLSFEDWKGLAR